ncbi:major facilitator superfamily domain-containing protein [Lentinula detonsa]|uniref:Major facilitator superfamily domain-containing protein n=1 Tax=Lentinula detonsa TaxID=2804962 RepID=A0AA38Q621_9AGAR|nr:major facilitator superfamily domain-containing protein [Lentinula detonsa]
MALAIDSVLVPLCTDGGKYGGKVKVIFRPQVQPWHASSTLVHEAGLALFKQQDEYFDIPTSTTTPLEVRSKLTKLAESVIGSSLANEFKDLLELKGSPNGGNAVTDDLKYTIKYSRQNSVHVSPTVLWDGLVANEISSSWGEKEWNDFLTAKAEQQVITEANKDKELHDNVSDNLSQELTATVDDYAAEAIETSSANDAEEAEKPEPLYSTFPKSQKFLILIVGSFAGLVSPLTGSIYLPALNSIAADLGVRTSLVNLTITTYQIFQGLAPSFLASLADTRGRRPTYLIAFSIYIIANLALALQHNYVALMVLRCMQSAGSSATIALGSAVVADIATRAERGSWVGYAGLGISLGPALGPTIGGLLDQYLGWRSIFWFLLILGSVLMVIILTFMPETGRAVVGNGSVKPARWNLSLAQWLRVRHGHHFNGTESVEEDRSTISKPKQRLNPFSALRILLEPEGGITLGFGAIFFAGYFMVLTTLSEQLAARFGFSSAIVGLCYLPLGFGSLCSRWTAGKLFDWNFRRHARLRGIPLDLSRQQKLEVFPIERIRLEICIPMIYISCGTVLGYAWAMQTNASLAGIEVSLFFLGLFISGAQQGLNTLVVDTHADTPATATAANNLFRCLMSSGGVAVAPFMIEKVGIGLMGVFISGVWLAFSPCLWAVLLYGKRWRESAKIQQDKKDHEKNNGHSV